MNELENKKAKVIRIIDDAEGNFLGYLKGATLAEVKEKVLDYEQSNNVKITIREEVRD